jgi:polyhydroxyalkanoate synthesis regulator phasin
MSKFESLGTRGAWAGASTQQARKNEGKVKIDIVIREGKSKPSDADIDDIFDSSEKRQPERQLPEPSLGSLSKILDLLGMLKNLLGGGQTEGQQGDYANAAPQPMPQQASDPGRDARRAEFQTKFNAAIKNKGDGNQMCRLVADAVNNGDLTKDEGKQLGRQIQQLANENGGGKINKKASKNLEKALGEQVLTKGKTRFEVQCSGGGKGSIAPELQALMQKAGITNKGDGNKMCHLVADAVKNGRMTKEEGKQLGRQIQQIANANGGGKINGKASKELESALGEKVLAPGNTRFETKVKGFLGAVGKSLWFIPGLSNVLTGIGNSGGGFLGALKGAAHGVVNTWKGVAEGVMDSIKRGRINPASLLFGAYTGALSETEAAPQPVKDVAGML